MTALLLFVVRVLLAVATERLLEGLIGLARAAHLSTLAVGALLAGVEAVNVAVGLAGRCRRGSARGFWVGVRRRRLLGLRGARPRRSAVPLLVELPRNVLGVLIITPVLVGLPLLGDTSRDWRFLRPSDCSWASWSGLPGCTALSIRTRSRKRPRRLDGGLPYCS